MRERPTPRETGRLIDVDEREFVYLVKSGRVSRVECRAVSGEPQGMIFLAL